jgi:hypothetical protein
VRADRLSLYALSFRRGPPAIHGPMIAVPLQVADLIGKALDCASLHGQRLIMWLPDPFDCESVGCHGAMSAVIALKRFTRLLEVTNLTRTAGPMHGWCVSLQLIVAYVPLLF